MAEGRSLLDVLNGFVVELRKAGLPVSLTEHIDAMEALRVVDLADRESVKYALASTMVKSHSHWRPFETVFEVYFSTLGGAAAPDEVHPGRPLDEDVDAMLQQLHRGQPEGGGLGELTADELAEMLYRALLEGDEAMAKALARQAVTRFAKMEPGRPVGGTYYQFRTLRQLDLEAMLQRLLDQAEKDADGGLTDFERRLARDEFESRMDRLRKEVEAEIRRRLVAERGVHAMAKTLRRPLPEDIDFMHATAEEMAQLRRALHPLTRKLAVRLARKRRHGR
ncbi:MAG: hypothetical protein WKF86_07105, partial [Acidimicrobiales bacterium]